MDESDASHEKRQGNGFRILTETIVSPTLGAQIQAVLKKYPAAKWHQFDPAGPHSARAAADTLFGRPVNTYYKLDAADVVLSLDADFSRAARLHAICARFRGRRRQGDRLDMNRLYVIESTMTATGGKADHRLAVRYSDVESSAREIVRNLGVDKTQGSPNESHAPWLQAVAKDLLAHKGASVVIAGESQSPQVHVLAHLMNAALG